MAIEFHENPSAEPDVVRLPEPGKTKICFDASGPGEVTVVYSIASKKSARFLVDGELTRTLERRATLTANPQTICKKVQLGRRLPEKQTETFTITVRIKPDRADEPPAQRACFCAYYWEEE